MQQACDPSHDGFRPGHSRRTRHPRQDQVRPHYLPSWPAAGGPLERKPAYTSQTCSACGYIDKANRPSQAVFACGVCGFHAHAAHNAAINIPVWAGLPPRARSARGTGTSARRGRSRQGPQQPVNRMHGWAGHRLSRRDIWSPIETVPFWSGSPSSVILSRCRAGHDPCFRSGLCRLMPVGQLESAVLSHCAVPLSTNLPIHQSRPTIGILHPFNDFGRVRTQPAGLPRPPINPAGLGLLPPPRALAFLTFRPPAARGDSYAHPLHRH